MVNKTIKEVSNAALPEDDWILYELGKANWDPAWVPDLRNASRPSIELTESELIDVIILGDGYENKSQFEQVLQSWLNGFFNLAVYQKFAGAFRIRAIFTPSAGPASSNDNLRQRDTTYKIQRVQGKNRLACHDKWMYKESFLNSFWDSIESISFNDRQYPDSLDVTTNPAKNTTNIHNQLARLYSNCVVAMLVRGPGRSNCSGFTRIVPPRHENDTDERDGLRCKVGPCINVAFGANSTHEFGHAFGYLEDEYIRDRGTSASNRRNPEEGSIFTLSNLSFDKQSVAVPWIHLSPWGWVERQAAGDEPSPLVGWLWRGGEKEHGVWHSEYQCLMNGTHKNYAYTHKVHNGVRGARDPSVVGSKINLRKRRFCIWCQEIVTARILEKTGQLAEAGDPDNIQELGKVWYERWTREWRPLYRTFFGVDQQLRDREAWYANPSNRIELLKCHDLFLWNSDLYEVPSASRRRQTGTAGSLTDEEILLLMNGAP